MANNNVPFSQNATQQINGPLADLYSSSYNFSGLYYPRDLGTQARGHYINFYINVAENTKYMSGQSYSSVVATPTGAGTSSVLAAGGRSALNQANDAKLVPGGEKVQQAQSALTTRKTKRITQAIALYMPDSVNVSYNAEWQSDSLTDALGKLGEYGSLAASASKDFMSNKSVSALKPGLIQSGVNLVKGALGMGEGATDFALFSAGYAANPQLEVLFKGTQMRTFQFDFMFSPFNADESKNVQNIIKLFRFHQAPEVVTDSVGRFFVPPSEFDIDFLFNGQINPNLHQVGSVVLTGMNVDYSPNGWSTFADGSPTNIRMSLQFTETEIVTKQRVAQDNY